MWTNPFSLILFPNWQWSQASRATFSASPIPTPSWSSAPQTVQEPTGCMESRWAGFNQTRRTELRLDWCSQPRGSGGAPVPSPCRTAQQPLSSRPTRVIAFLQGRMANSLRAQTSRVDAMHGLTLGASAFGAQLTGIISLPQAPLSKAVIPPAAGVLRPYALTVCLDPFPRRWSCPLLSPRQLHSS